MKHKATQKQLNTLRQLISEVEPEMILPQNLTKAMASNRIAYLLRKKEQPQMKKRYMN